VRNRPIPRILWATALALLLSVRPSAQTASNVLVVVNQNDSESVRVGEHYASRRQVPPDHVVRLESVVRDVIEREVYQRSIEAPIADWLSRHRLQDQVLYLVLSSGFPLRISGVSGLQGTSASVDSELTLLYRKLLGDPAPLLGRVENPYFLADRPLESASAFSRFDSDIYLVTRLDAFSLDETLALIDRAATPSREGRIVLDQRAQSPADPGDRWLLEAAERIGQVSTADRALLESSRERATTGGPVLGYYSWGSGDPANRQRRSALEFVNGALAAMFVGADGRTFHEPPADWALDRSTPGLRSFAGAAQSLAGDLIRDGVTGVGAHVADPLLDGSIRPQVLFPAYLGGFNLAESFYLATPFLSWQTIVVGDPLCAPFPRPAFSTELLHKGIDPDTELPALFAERRLALLARDGLSTDGLKLMLKADARIARGDHASAEELLVRATEIEPRLTRAQLRLATWYDERQDYDSAVERYRQILSHDPDNVVALNNLAYALAVHKATPAEALPLAERAHRLSAGRNSLIADTLGWIHHLLGDNAAAAPLVEQALRGNSRHVEILIHAATVHAAMGDRARARLELETATKLDPTVNERADVAALRQRLAGQP